MYFKKQIQHIAISFLLICISINSFAQKNIQKADAYYDRSFFKEAIPFYEAEIKEGRESKTKEKATERLANCYRLIGDFAKAEALYKELVKKNTNNAEHLLHYASSLKASSKYAEAADEFKKYIQLKPNDPMGKVYLESCQLAQLWLDEKLGNEVKHPEIFNTPHSEFATTFWKNGVLFCSSRENSKRPFIDFEGGNTEPKLDFYFINLKKPYDSLKVEKFDKDLLNSFQHEGPCTFTPNGDTIYFTRTVKGVRDLKKNVRLKTLQLYTSQRNNLGKWSKPVSAFTFNSKSYNCLHPSVAPSDRFMVFASDMPGGQGATDLYISYREGKNSWSTPVNLGSIINTFGSELYPYILDDHTIYFSSDAHPGMGKLDIFKTEYIDGKWTQPQNLKPPFNSIGDDFGFIMDRQSNHGFFSSDRFDSKGLDDIYAFSEFDPTLIIAEGATIKIPDNSIFDGLNFKIQEKDTKQDSDMVSSAGFYHFTPDTGKSYVISIRKDGFSYNKIDLNLRRNSGEYFLNWQIKPNKKEIQVAGKLLAYTEETSDSLKTEKPVAANYVLIRHNGNTLNQTATDINGLFKFKEFLEPKKTYDLISTKKGKATTYSLTGQVLNDNIPIQDVELLLMKDGIVYDSSKTDNLGFYNFNGLVPANDFVVVTSKSGFKKSLHEISAEDFLGAEDKGVYKNITIESISTELTNELAKNNLNENTITTKPGKSFELALKITDKGKPLNNATVKIFENGALLTETITDKEGFVGAKHLDKTKSYTIVATNNDAKENIYQLDTNEYRDSKINIVSKQIDFTGVKFNKNLIDKDLKKINKTNLFNTTDSLYFAKHLKTIRGNLSIGEEPLKSTEIKVFQNGELIEKIKTNEEGNYNFDKLNTNFNYEFVVSSKLTGITKFEILKEDLKRTKENELLRNINLKGGIAISERNKKGNTEDLKMHLEGLGKNNEGVTVKLFENGHLRAEVPLDQNNNVNFGNLDPNKSYDVSIAKGEKEFTIVPIPARSDYFTIGDTVDVSKGLNENGIIPLKLDLNSTGKGSGTLNKNGIPLSQTKFKLFVNGQLAEEGKTDTYGKFALSKLNIKNTNTIEFIDKSGNIIVEDMTEQDFKELATGKKIFEFEDPELNHHSVTQNNEKKISTQIALNNELIQAEVEIFENGNLIDKLKTNSENKIDLVYLDPTKKYLAKTKINNIEYVSTISRNQIYNSSQPKITFIKTPKNSNSNIQKQASNSNNNIKGSPFPIEGKLTNNGIPLSNIEIRVIENGKLLDLLETNQKGEYLLTGIDPAKNIKIEVYEKTGKRELLLASSLNNSAGPVSNITTDISKTNLISDDNLEDEINSNIKEIVAEGSKLNTELREKIQSTESEKSSNVNEFYDPNSIVKGNVSFNGIPSSATTVSIKKEGEILAQKLSNADGNFSFETIKEPGNYEIEFNKEGFNNETIRITTTDFTNNSINKINQKLNLKNAINYNGHVTNNDKKVANATVSLTYKNRVVGKTTANEQGQFNFQLEQGKEYGLIAASKDFFNSETYVTTHDKLANTTTDGTIKMNTIELNKAIRLDNIYYDFNSPNIRIESLPELEKLADFMKLNPKVKIEIRSHTDNRGDESYNLKLSLERAHNVVLFLMIEDVEKQRMNYKGFGETIPIIANAQNEEEHQYNRRTELIVLEK